MKIVTNKELQAFVAAKDALHAIVEPANELGASALALMIQRLESSEEEWNEAVGIGGQAMETLVRDIGAAYAEIERTAFALMGEKRRAGESPGEFCERVVGLGAEGIARYMNKNQVAYWVP